VIAPMGRDAGGHYAASPVLPRCSCPVAQLLPIVSTTSASAVAGRCSRPNGAYVRTSPCGVMGHAFPPAAGSRPVLGDPCTEGVESACCISLRLLPVFPAGFVTRQAAVVIPGTQNRATDVSPQLLLWRGHPTRERDRKTGTTSGRDSQEATSLHEIPSSVNPRLFLIRPPPPSHLTGKTRAKRRPANGLRGDDDGAARWTKCCPSTPLLPAVEARSTIPGVASRRAMVHPGPGSSPCRQSHTRTPSSWPR